MEDSRGSQQEGDAVLGVSGRPEEGLTGAGIAGDPSAAQTPGLQGKSVYKCDYARFYPSTKTPVSVGSP